MPKLTFMYRIWAKVWFLVRTPPNPALINVTQKKTPKTSPNNKIIFFIEIKFLSQGGMGKALISFLTRCIHNPKTSPVLNDFKCLSAGSIKNISGPHGFQESLSRKRHHSSEVSSSIMLKALNSGSGFGGPGPGPGPASGPGPALRRFDFWGGVSGLALIRKREN